MSLWSIELEPEVEQWLESLPAGQFATVASRIEYLADHGAATRMPRSQSLGEGLFELRFDLAQKAQRISFFFPGGKRVVMLTTFRKQRQNERAEVTRARRAMARCIAEGHTVEGETE
jgi:phage-related protein